MPAVSSLFSVLHRRPLLILPLPRDDPVFEEMDLPDFRFVSFRAAFQSGSGQLSDRSCASRFMLVSQLARRFAMVAQKAPFFLLSLGFMGITIAVRDVAPLWSGPSWFHGEDSSVESCAPIFILHREDGFSAGTAGFYPIPLEQDMLRSPAFIASALVTVAVFSGLFFFRKHVRSLWLAWLFYFAVLLPNLGIIAFSTAVLTADRYSYISCFAWFALGAYGMSQLLERLNDGPRKFTFVAGIAAISVALSMLTWHQQAVWRNSESFWTHAWFHGGKDSFMVNEAMGKELSSRGKSGDALEYYQRALASHPSREQQLAVLNSISVIFCHEGKLDESIQWVLKALAVKSDDSYTRNNLGVILDKMGFIDEAALQFQKALLLKSDNEDARANLENSVRWRSSLDADITRFSGEVKSHPSDPDLHNHLGAVLGTRGRLDEAIAQFRAALRLDPKNVTAERNLASGIELQKKKIQLPRF